MVRRLALMAICLAVVAPTAPLASGTATAVTPAHTAIVGPQTVVTGKVQHNGTASTAAQVLVRVWPANKVLADLPDDGSVDVPVKYMGSVGSDGTFAIPLDVASLSAAYVEPEGNVALELVATTGSVQASWNFSARFTADKGWLAASSSDDGKDVRPNVVLDLGTSASATDRDGKTLLETSAKSPVWGPDQAGCAPVRPGGWLYGQNEYFARVMGSPKAPASMTQSRGIDHQLGIGIKSPQGTWSASGTASTSLELSATTPQTQASRWEWNKINYRDFYNNCYIYQRRPVSVYSLHTAFTLFTRPEYSYCAPLSAGATYRKYTGRNTSFSTGMDIGPINVTAQAGWNSQMTIEWKAKQSTRICGNTSQGPGASPEAQTK